MEELLSYITKEKKGKEPLLWKKESGGDFPLIASYTAVIVTGGERVTLQYFPKQHNLQPTLSFWWRKNGTTSTDTMWTSSVGFDGLTHGGSDPAENKNAMLDPDRSPERQIGVEHRQFWQDECNKRIQAALTYYRGKKITERVYRSEY